jgi:cytochrome P450
MVYSRTLFLYSGGENFVFRVNSFFFFSFEILFFFLIQFAHSVVSMLRSMIPGYLWWWNYVELFAFDRKYTQSRNTMHGVVDQVIQHFKQELTRQKEERGDSKETSAEGGVNKKKGANSERQQQCVLSKLLRLREESGLNVSDQAILLNIMTVLFAGHDTTMNSITWAIYYLYRDAHVLARARAEIADLFGDSDALERPYDIESLSYLRAVVKESMRLRMSAPMGVGRVCVKDTKIQWIGTGIPCC